MLPEAHHLPEAHYAVTSRDDLRDRAPGAPPALRRIPRQGAGGAARSPATARWRRGLRWGRRHAMTYGRSLTGMSFAVVSLCLALTPSLLPRTWVQQGLIGGASATVSYATGVVIGWIGWALLPARWVEPLRRRGWRVFAVAAPLLLAVALYRGSGWQRDIYRLMGQHPPPRYGYLGVVVVSGAVFLGCVAVVRGLRAVTAALRYRLRRWLPARVAGLVAVTAVLLAFLGVLDKVVYDGGTWVAASMAGSVNGGTAPGVTRPFSPLRSGSPASLVDWRSLGREGRSFVAGGPSVDQLGRFNGTAAREPIRVYVGAAAAPTVDDAATLAVRELERTGAFTRAVLCVITTTGTGWVDPKASAALEYLYNGDTAQVGIQYSYLPSWVSFLVQSGRPALAGRALFDRVYARWSTLPAATRPRLLVFGESLGSLGSEAAFSGVDDITRTVDGVLWIGPTSANDLRQRLTAQRDPGTPEVLPTYQGGAIVRFASNPPDLDDCTDGHRPQVIYLQHPSDPVVWWSPSLLWRTPDWLAEPRGADVLPAMRWYPFVTFFQVSVDLDAAYASPPGHGHRYGAATVAAWACLAAPPGWTADRTQELIAVVAPRG